MDSCPKARLICSMGNPAFCAIPAPVLLSITGMYDSIYWNSTDFMEHPGDSDPKREEYQKEVKARNHIHLDLNFASFDLGHQKLCPYRHTFWTAGSRD